MNRKEKQLVTLLIVLVSVMGGSLAVTCDCPERPDVPGALRTSGFVFLGKVVSVNNQLVLSERIWYAVKSQLQRDDLTFSEDPLSRIRFSHERTVKFDVSAVWKGMEVDQIELHDAGTTCDYFFEYGNSYLVYCKSVKGRYRADVCNRTCKISDCGHDLETLGSPAYQKTRSANGGAVSMLGIFTSIPFQLFAYLISIGLAILAYLLSRIVRSHRLLRQHHPNITIVLVFLIPSLLIYAIYLIPNDELRRSFLVPVPLMCFAIPIGAILADILLSNRDYLLRFSSTSTYYRNHLLQIVVCLLITCAIFSPLAIGATPLGKRDDPLLITVLWPSIVALGPIVFRRFHGAAANFFVNAPYDLMRPHLILAISFLGWYAVTYLLYSTIQRLCKVGGRARTVVAETGTKAP